MSFFEILFYIFLGLMGVGLIFNSIGYLLPASYQIASVFVLNAFRAELQPKLFSTQAIAKWFYPVVKESDILIDGNKIEIKSNGRVLRFSIEENNPPEKILISSVEVKSEKSDSVFSKLKLETESAKNGIEIRITENFEFNKPVLRLLFKLYYQKEADMLHKKRIEKIKHQFEIQ